MPESQTTVDEEKSTTGRDEESASDENPVKTNPEKKTSEEYSMNVNPSEQGNRPGGEPADLQPGEDERIRSGEKMNRLSERDENEVSGDNENLLTGQKAIGTNTVKTGEEGALPSAEMKKTDDAEAEKAADEHTDHRGWEMKRDKAHEKKQRSLYEWRREKPAKSPKPVKAVKKPVQLRNGVVLGEGLPKICVPLTGKGKDELEAQARQIAAVSPDLVEWRADYFKDLGDVEKVAEVLMSLRDILGEAPILFTIRTKREGGEGELAPEEYRSLILYAAGRPEVSLIDIEGLNPEINTELLISEVHELGMPVIASWHNFSRTPKKPELDLVFDRLTRTGADVLKVAVMPKKPKDVLRLMSVTEEKNRQIPNPLVTMAMGDLGRLSRVSGRITGSVMTFGIVGDASAPGQLPVGELREMIGTI